MAKNEVVDTEAKTLTKKEIKEQKKQEKLKQKAMHLGASLFVYVGQRTWLLPEKQILFYKHVGADFISAPNFFY